MSPAPEVLCELRIPHETVNDDVVIVNRWRVQHGSAVRAQDVVVEIETSKAVIEVEAEADGFLEILHPEGAEVPVGEVIGKVLAAAVGSESPSASAPTPGAARDSDAPATISKKAQRLIDEHGIDVAIFEGKGLVREVDVIRALEQRESESAGAEGGEASEVAAPETPRAVSGATTSLSSGPSSRGLFGDASASAAERGESLLWLAWNYFWRNWLLGNLVKVAPRGVINVLHRWRGVTMGDDCFIDPSATLETAYPENITMGDDVRVTVGAIVMTHIKAPHYLRRTGLVPATLAPVLLKDHCFIGVNSVIMPGVTVGKASVVASGAVVVSNVPDYTMVAGNPAKIVKRFPKSEA